MNMFKPLSDCVLCELIFTKVSEIIHVEESKEDVEKFGTVIGIGPDVENIQIGDEVLIPPMNTGRELIALDDKAYAVFRAKTAMLVKQNI